MIDKLDALNKARKNPDLNLDQLRSATLALQSAMANCADEIIEVLKWAKATIDAPNVPKVYGDPIPEFELECRLFLLLRKGRR